jgi:hypothetical protein
MPKRPSFQFYPGDWVRDSVAGCSLAAQGLWLRIMNVAHDSERYGYLVQNGVAMPPEAIARRCGCSVEQFEELLQELNRAGVPSRTADGIIYSRRMVRDEHLRQVRASGGSESLNNPNVARPKVKDGLKAGGKDGSNGTREDGGKDGGKDAGVATKPQPSNISLGVSPSSSSSSSSSNPKIKTLAPLENNGTGKTVKAPKRESPVDLRYTPTRGMLTAAFRQVCSAEESAPWDGHCAKELADWLASHNLTLEDIEKLIQAAAKSERAEQLMRVPAQLIPTLRKYTVPLDRFSNPIKKTGNGVSVDRSLNRYTNGVPGAIVACGEEKSR